MVVIPDELILHSCVFIGGAGIKKKKNRFLGGGGGGDNKDLGIIRHCCRDAPKLCQWLFDCDVEDSMWGLAMILDIKVFFFTSIFDFSTVCMRTLMRLR